MTGKGITLIRLLPGDYAGAGKGQQRHKATKASPYFEKTVTFRGKPAVGKNYVVQIPRVKNSNGSQTKAMDRAGLESSSWPAVGAWLGQIRVDTAAGFSRAGCGLVVGLVVGSS